MDPFEEPWLKNRLRARLQAALDSYYKNYTSPDSGGPERKLNNDIRNALADFAIAEGAEWPEVPMDTMIDIVRLAYNMGWEEGYIRG